jgi:hypothetical protein
MKTSSSEKRKLANDILQDANYAAFRQELEKLGRAEMRRLHRPAVPLWLPMAASAIFVATLLYWAAKPERNERPPAPTADSALTVVRSSPLSFAEIVRSASDQATLLKTRPASEHEVVRTDTSAKVYELTDSELLALLSDRSGGFVKIGDQKRLVLFF